MLKRFRRGQSARSLNENNKGVNGRRSSWTSTASSCSTASPRHESQINDDIKKNKNYKLVDKVLRKVGKSLLGQELSLDSKGLCYIPCKQFLICIEVPHDAPDLHFIHSMIFDSRTVYTNRNVQAICKRNASLRIDSHDANVIVNGREVNLFMAIPSSGGTSQRIFMENLESFLQAAIQIHSSLKNASITMSRAVTT